MARDFARSAPKPALTTADEPIIADALKMFRKLPRVSVIAGSFSSALVSSLGMVGSVIATTLGSSRQLPQRLLKSDTYDELLLCLYELTLW
jgi:hypothetical protein